MEMDLGLPLQGIRVLDLTRVRAGPTATRQFVHWGAEVIKIEAPLSLTDGVDMGGPRYDSDFQNLNGGKLSLSLNLKKEKGRELFYDLVKKSDVVVENFRSDVKDKLKINYEQLKEINPGIIYASISGFGQDGPYSKRPGFDQIIQGMSGLMSVTGHPGTPFVRSGIAVADSVTGQMCAQGIFLALLKRQRTGQGSWVQVSLLETLINLMDFQAVRYLNEKQLPIQVGTDHAQRMPTGIYKTADGVLTICAAADGMWKGLCREIGREDLITNELYVDQKARSKNRESLNKELEEALQKHSTKYWIERLNTAGVACGPVYNVAETFADEQVQHLDLVRTVEHQKLGMQQVLAQPIRLQDLEAQDNYPAPERGEHNQEILTRVLGLMDTDVEQLYIEEIL